jgi:hypothetical protein
MPVASSAQLCNRSLRLIGQETVSSIDDEGKVGSSLRLLYPMVRDRLLASGRWGFATTRAALATVVTENYTKFTYSYQMPIDPVPISIQMITDINGYEYPDLQYVIENDVLFCELTEPILVYTRSEDDVTKFPEHFINALQLYLAAELSYELDGQVRNDLLGLGKSAYHEAQVKEMRSSRHARKKSLPWVAARFTRGILNDGLVRNWGI